MTGVRHLLAPALATLASCASVAPPERPARAAVRSDGEPGLTVELPEGRTATVQVLLFDSADAFVDLRNTTRRRSVGPEESALVRFEDLPPGRYAVCAFLDENENGVLDRSFLGIPVEPVGFSNDYEPKGPPTFEPASLAAGGGAAVRTRVELTLPLGRYGRIGVGPAVLLRSSPYRDADGVRVNAIPAITFIGDRIAFLGPSARVGIVGSDRARLAASASLRFPAYEEDDSPFLSGMGDRDSTLMAGLAGVFEFGSNVDLEVSYEFDLLDEIGGERASVSLQKAFQLGRTRLTPELELLWQSEELADHDFGVPAASATPGRPAYSLSDTVTPSIGVGSFVELSTDWRIIADLSLAFLPSEVTDSPLVDEDTVLSFFFAVSYVL